MRFSDLALATTASLQDHGGHVDAAARSIGPASTLDTLKRFRVMEAGGPDMFYSVDRRGLYQTGGTLDLWQEDPLGRPFWRLPDWFVADDLRAHVAELFPNGLSLHGWQYMVERHDFIRPADSNALFVNHNMVVELVFEYVR